MPCEWIQERPPPSPRPACGGGFLRRRTQLRRASSRPAASFDPLRKPRMLPPRVLRARRLQRLLRRWTASWALGRDRLCGDVGERPKKRGRPRRPRSPTRPQASGRFRLRLRLPQASACEAGACEVQVVTCLLHPRPPASRRWLHHRRASVREAGVSAVRVLACSLHPRPPACRLRPPACRLRPPACRRWIRRCWYSARDLRRCDRGRLCDGVCALLVICLRLQAQRGGHRPVRRR